jgi:hypothetical protein
MILAIDPGPEQSAYVLWDGAAIHEHGKEPNSSVLSYVIGSRMLLGEPRLAIEKIASYGMAVGAEVFETCVWSGRFMQAFGADKCDRITRGEVKMHLCGSMRAKDANIRQALIDRFGGKERAIGKKAAPGPLFGISGDVWAALAVAVTWHDKQELARRIA